MTRAAYTVQHVHRDHIPRGGIRARERDRPHLRLRPRRRQPRFRHRKPPLPHSEDARPPRRQRLLPTLLRVRACLRLRAVVLRSYLLLSRLVSSPLSCDSPATHTRARASPTHSLAILINARHPGFKVVLLVYQLLWILCAFVFADPEAEDGWVTVPAVLHAVFAICAALALSESDPPPSSTPTSSSSRSSSTFSRNKSKNKKE